MCMKYYAIKNNNWSMMNSKWYFIVIMIGRHLIIYHIEIKNIEYKYKASTTYLKIDTHWISNLFLFFWVTPNGTQESLLALLSGSLLVGLGRRYLMSGIDSGLTACKRNTLPVVLLHWPSNFFILVEQSSQVQNINIHVFFL